jgi:hypothetical protein
VSGCIIHDPTATEFGAGTHVGGDSASRPGSDPVRRPLQHPEGRECAAIIGERRVCRLPLGHDGFHEPNERVGWMDGDEDLHPERDDASA